MKTELKMILTFVTFEREDETKDFEVSQNISHHVDLDRPNLVDYSREEQAKAISEGLVEVIKAGLDDTHTPSDESSKPLGILVPDTKIKTRRNDS